SQYACSKSSAWKTYAWRRSRSGSRRFTCRGRAIRCVFRAIPKRCTCCNKCETKRTASRSRTTGNCGKKMTTSVLDNVAGLGPARKKRLLKEFGSVKKLRELEEADLVALAWLPEAVARATYAQLHGIDRASMNES